MTKKQGKVYSYNTVLRKKTLIYVFDYSSGVSWSISILFVPVETEINTLQQTYLLSWWRQNCVTLHVTNVYWRRYFLTLNTLSLKIKSWSKKPVKIRNILCQKTVKMSYKNLGHIKNIHLHSCNHKTVTLKLTLTLTLTLTDTGGAVMTLMLGYRRLRIYKLKRKIQNWDCEKM